MTDLLPNGDSFARWEPSRHFSHTYHVAQAHPAAADTNPGTPDKPFRTINAAAQIVQPGQRVLVQAGIYREAVRPARGGSRPDEMISYQAAPGEEVIIRGSEIYRGVWLPTGADWGGLPKPGLPPLWEVILPEEWFVGTNPFGAVNLSRYDDGEELTANAGRLQDPNMRVYLLRRGLVFQDGRRLKQVFLREELALADGTYWVDRDGLEIALRPYGDVAPDTAVFEFTARRHCFAPAVRYQNYLHVKGFTMEHAGDGFPRPQAGLLSAARGHHWLIEDNTIRQANGCGMDLASQSKYESATPGDHIVRRNTVEYCGICGICGTGSPSNLLVEDNLLRGNCWQNLGNLEEAAAIKFHVTTNAVVRRNLILDTGGEAGNGAGIWMDWDCRNSRVSSNVILRTKTVYGAIFVEASRSKLFNLVDDNIILDTDGHGIYSHNGDRLEVRRNLVAQSKKAGVQLGWSDPNLWVGPDGEEPRGATGRKNIVQENLLVGNRIQIELDNPDNTSDYNVFGSPSEEGPGAFRLRRSQENLNLSAWREFYGLDTHSARVSVTLTEEDNALLVTVKGNLPWDETENASGPLAGLTSGSTAQLSLDPRHLAGS